jgi:hypothetical protein
MSNDVTTIEAELLADLAMKRPPSIVLEEARQAAVCLKDVLDSKAHKVMMNDEQYLEFEDWQTVGKFYGVTCGEEGEPLYVELGAAKGFKATCVALHNGKVISRATAFCLSDEEKWGERNKYAYAYCKQSGGTSVDDPGSTEIIWIPNPNKPGRSMPKKERVLVGQESVPLYQLASMAQTRANAKALRNVLSWVVVLAGYRPTPSEELLEARVVPQAEVKAQAPINTTETRPAVSSEHQPAREAPAPSHAEADATIAQRDLEQEYRARFTTTFGAEANKIQRELVADARLTHETKERLYTDYAKALKTKAVR